MLQTVIALVIFALTLLLIIVRPKGINEAIVALGGAALMVLAGVISPVQALETLRDKLDVFFFFLGLMSIAAIAENARFFDWMAYLAGKQAKGSGKKLFLNVFLLGTLISAFLSNDATALILTPVVYALVVRLRIDPLPFMFACTFIADTASYILPVSNPINILVLGQFPSSLPDFLKRLLLPSIICIFINIAFFFWLFRREIPAHFDPTHLENPLPTLKNPRFFRYTTFCLALVALGYVVASTTGLSLAIVAMGGAILMVGGSLVMHQLSLRELGGEVSWSLFGFIGGMFIVIRGVENIGLTGEIGKLIVQAGSGNLFLTIMITTLGTALGANLINNVPMTLVMISALAQQAAQLAPNLKEGMAYATMFGADLGPNLTTIGSLATVLWLVILRRKGLEVSSAQYFKIGVLVTPLMLLLGALAIWLSVSLF